MICVKKSPTEIEPFIRENTIRQLTEEEIFLLQPYLDNKYHITDPYQWESSLISSNVIRINAYVEKDYLNENSYDYFYKMGNMRLFFSL